MTQNQIAYQAHLENKRANEARETETHRSNIANEEENKRYHTESIKETQRSNLAREAENQRSNLAREAETNRSNVAKETETNRSNLAKEAETHRSNLANEMLKATEIRTRSEDTRYTADVGYQGRVDAAYISQWGVSPTDVSSLASTIGKGVTKAMPVATGVAKAAAGFGNSLAARVATAPVRAVIDAAGKVRTGVHQIVQPSNRSTKSGRTNQKPAKSGKMNQTAGKPRSGKANQTTGKSYRGGHRYVKKKQLKRKKF